MTNNIGDLDPANEDTDLTGNQEDFEETPPEESDEDSEEIKSLKQKNQSLYEQLKKAKGFERDKDGKWIKKPEKPTPEVKPQTPISGIDVNKVISETLDQRDLEALDIGDELRKEVRGYAKLHNVSIKKALDSQYIQFLQEKENKERKVEGASLGGKTRSSQSQDFEKKSPEDFDLRTEEGRQGWAEYKEWLRSQ